MKIGSSFIIVLQVVIAFVSACLGLPCRRLYGTVPTAYAGFSGPTTYLGTPNILTSQPYSLSPAYPAYLTPLAQPGPYTYNVLQQPPRVPPTYQGPYSVSLFQEVAPSLPIPQTSQGAPSLSTPTVFTPQIIPSSTTSSILPQKRSVSNSTKVNLLEQSPLKEPTGAKPLPPEVYVPEDKYLPPTLHRFPHDTFPYHENKKHRDVVPVDEKMEMSLGDESKKCSSAVGCSSDNQERDVENQEDNERKDNEKVTESGSLLYFNHNSTYLHVGEESHTYSLDKDKVDPDNLNREMIHDVLVESKQKNTTTLSTGGNGELPKTIDLDKHPQHFETNDMYKLKRDTHSTTFFDNSTTLGRKETKAHPCRCLQKLRKCVHDVSNMADYLVKKACYAFRNREESED